MTEGHQGPHSTVPAQAPAAPLLPQPKWPPASAAQAGPTPPTGPYPGWTTAAPARNSGGGCARPMIGVLSVMAVLGLAWLASTGQLRGLPSTGVGGNGGPVTVTHHLSGSATSADITYTDGSGNIQQQTSIKVPLRNASSGAEGMRITARHGAYVTILAQNKADSCQWPRRSPRWWP